MVWFTHGVPGAIRFKRPSLGYTTSCIFSGWYWPKDPLLTGWNPDGEWSFHTVIRIGWLVYTITTLTEYHLISSIIIPLRHLLIPNSFGIPMPCVWPWLKPSERPRELWPTLPPSWKRRASTRAMLCNWHGPRWICGWHHPIVSPWPLIHAASASLCLFWSNIWTFDFLGMFTSYGPKTQEAEKKQVELWIRWFPPGLQAAKLKTVMA